MNIENTLEQRTKTHGNFETHAEISQALKDVIHLTEGFTTLTCSQAESLEMIMHKIARILNGNPNTHDHWHDIAGYSTLVANQLIQKCPPCNQDCNQGRKCNATNNSN